MTVQGHTVGGGDAGRKLVDVVKDRLGAVAIREVGELLRAGRVLVDGTPGCINDPAVAGAVLTLAPTALATLRSAGRVTEPSPVALDVLHEDDHLLVVDKPAGMHVHPLGPHRDDTLVGALLWRAGARPDRPWSAWRPRPTHRLDRATSGVLLVARHAAVQRAVDELREQGLVTRLYRATVQGRVGPDAGTLDVPLGVVPGDDRRRGHVPRTAGGQHAVTHWRVLARGAATTEVELRLDTGRTHQIRAHMAHLGHPVQGDTLYAAHATDEAPDASPAIALRATTLELPHPVSGEPLLVEAAR